MYDADMYVFLQIMKSSLAVLFDMSGFRDSNYEAIIWASFFEV